MLPSDMVPPGQGSLMRRLADLERQIREMQASRRLEAATIGVGGLTVKGGTISVKDDGAISAEYPNGTEAFHVGAMMLSDGTPIHGVDIRRPGGEPAFWTYGTDEGVSSFWGLYDKKGNYVITDDAWTGRGLARPYIPLQVGDWASPPTATTTSGVFQDLAAGLSAIQHPVMYGYLLVRASDATTAGETRICIDDNPVGPVFTISAGSFGDAYLGPFAVNVAETNYGNIHRISVQARRTAGSGTIGVRVLSLLGLESSWAS